MNKDKEVLSKINKTHCNSKVNTNYFWLWKVITNKNELGLILYVLGFQQNNRKFYATDKQIAKVIGCKWRTIEGVVSRLKSKGYIKCDTNSNESNGYGGKTRFIVVNVPNLIRDYKNLIEENDDEIGNEPTPKETPNKEKRAKVSKEEELKVMNQKEFQVVFEDFNVRRLLENYLVNPEPVLVQNIDDNYLKHRAKHKIKVSDLISLVYFLDERYSEKPEIYQIIPELLNDIKRLRPELNNKESA